jgi:hypothetical protein
MEIVCFLPRTVNGREDKMPSSSSKNDTLPGLKEQCRSHPDHGEEDQTSLITYRSLGMTADTRPLGIYGFGAAAHIVTQVARHQGRQD